MSLASFALQLLNGLASASSLFLVAAGLSPDRIDAAPPCTMCRADLFYSFRRDGAGIGQMLSFIVAGSVEVS